MREVRSILVVVDPSAEQQPAVEKGATLARRLGARLELFACETRSLREIRVAKHLASGSGQSFEADFTPVLESLAEHVRKRGIEVGFHCGTASSLPGAVLARAYSVDIGLIVKDTHHHPLLKRTLMTNTDWQLIRGCRVPLLLVKPAAWHEQPVLIAAVDPMHPNNHPTLDQLILGWTRNFARCLEGTMHIAHAYLPVAIYETPPGALPALATSVSVEVLKAEERRHLAELVMLGRPYGIDERNIHMQMDSAAAFLPSLASELPGDIVVMGAISRSGLKRLFIGSTAEAVLERLPCDVLIVKTADVAEQLRF